MNNRNKYKHTRKALLLVILLTIIGMIYIYPDLRFILESGKHYKGIGFTGTSEELWYLSRLNGIYKGSVNLSDIYCFEHQNDPWFRPFIGEFIVGNIGKMFEISVVNLDILASAILNIILSFLIFTFSYQLSKSVRLSIICSFAIMLGYNIFTTNAHILKEVFIAGNYAKPLWFLRPLSPQFYYIPFFIALVYTNRATNLSANKNNIAIAGITLGLLFYCNVYYWTFIYAGLGVLFFSFFLIKEKRGALNVIYIYAISIIIAIPYLISVFKVINNPAYGYLQKNYMMADSHKIFLYAPYTIPAVFISILLVTFKHKSRFFIASFLIGGIICLNQQVVTGKIMLQQWSFYTNKTFLIISIIVSAKLILDGIGKLKLIRYNFLNNELCKTALSAIAVSVFIILAFLQQDNYYRINKEYFLEKQKIADVYKWLRENTNKSSVVLTDPYQDFSSHLTNYRFLLTYTNNFSYIAEPACMLISKEETTYRILASLIFLGYSRDDIENYINMLKQFYKSADPNNWIYSPSEGYYKIIRNEYNVLEKGNPVDMVRKYKIDYILVKNKIASKLASKYVNNLIVAYQDTHYTVFNLI
ncbi:MAG: hypothetical protein PHC54_00630 [Candidatus Omnitrophica bacterium]|nr:hypothetical protein [Candidatus Omnitrophota bacterium]MDD5591917.1 hypothetical protein [Candidatus Omnitrophota bacterium]